MSVTRPGKAYVVSVHRKEDAITVTIQAEVWFNGLGGYDVQYMVVGAEDAPLEEWVMKRRRFTFQMGTDWMEWEDVDDPDPIKPLAEEENHRQLVAEALAE